MNKAEQGAGQVSALGRRADEIAARDRNADLDELRIERIAIEGQIDETERSVETARRIRCEMKAAIRRDSARLDELRARLRARIDAIASMERSALGGRE